MNTETYNLYIVTENGAQDLDEFQPIYSANLGLTYWLIDGNVVLDNVQGPDIIDDLEALAWSIAAQHGADDIYFLDNDPAWESIVNFHRDEATAIFAWATSERHADALVAAHNRGELDVENIVRDGRVYAVLHGEQWGADAGDSTMRPATIIDDSNWDYMLCMIFDHLQITDEQIEKSTVDAIARASQDDDMVFAEYLAVAKDFVTAWGE